MRIYVQIDFQNDLEAALEFLEENDIEGRVIFDSSPEGVRKHMGDVLADEASDFLAGGGVIN